MEYSIYGVLIAPIVLLLVGFHIVAKIMDEYYSLAKIDPSIFHYRRALVFIKTVLGVIFMEYT